MRNRMLKIDLERFFTRIQDYASERPSSSLEPRICLKNLDSDGVSHQPKTRHSEEPNLQFVMGKGIRGKNAYPHRVSTAGHGAMRIPIKTKLKIFGFREKWRSFSLGLMSPVLVSTRPLRGQRACGLRRAATVFCLLCRNVSGSGPNFMAFLPWCWEMPETVFADGNLRAEDGSVRSAHDTRTRKLPCSVGAPPRGEGLALGWLAQ